MDIKERKGEKGARTMNKDGALEKLYRLKSITHGVKYREELQEVIDWIRELKK